MNLVQAVPLSVTLQLSRHQVKAGESIQMNINLDGAENARFPQQIHVDGLDIRFVGESHQMSMINGDISARVMASYIVTPLDTGRFMIPPIAVTVNGQEVKTQPATLLVQGIAGPHYQGRGPRGRSLSVPPGFPPGLSMHGGRGSSSQDDSQQDHPPQPIAYAELELSTKNPYVGEIVPLKVHYYLDTLYHATPIGFSNRLEGEGVSVSLPDEPQEVHPVERHGNIYQEITFEGTLSALKAGKIELHPETLQISADDPNMNITDNDDFFDDMDALFAQMAQTGMPMMQRQQKMEIKTDAIKLEVKPLPEEEKPADFSGAVGEFTLSGSVDPHQAKVGDVVTMTTTLTGRGNFSAMHPPHYNNTDGWRTYPPAEHFEPQEGLDYQGSKSFEMTMIPKEEVKKTPSAAFSFFDPKKERYVTLEQSSEPVEIAPGQGGDSSQATPPTTNTSPESGNSPKKASSQKELPITHFVHWENPLQRSELLWAWLMLWGATAILAFYLIGKRATLLFETEEKRCAQHLKLLWERLQDPQIGADTFYHDTVEYLALLYKVRSQKPSLYDTNNQEELLHLLQFFTQKRDELAYGARSHQWDVTQQHRYLKQLAPYVVE